AATGQYLTGRRRTNHHDHDEKLGAHVHRQLRLAPRPGEHPQPPPGTRRRGERRPQEHEDRGERERRERDEQGIVHRPLGPGNNHRCLRSTTRLTTRLIAKMIAASVTAIAAPDPTAPWRKVRIYTS